MCGIFWTIPIKRINKKNFSELAKHSRQRGKDSSGLIFYDASNYVVNRADFDILKLLDRVKPYSSKLVLGHSRLITNGLEDNQPVVRNGLACIHNGIIVNENEIIVQ